MLAMESVALDILLPRADVTLFPCSDVSQADGWKIPVCFLVWRENVHHGPLSVLQDCPEH